MSQKTIGEIYVDNPADPLDGTELFEIEQGGQSAGATGSEIVGSPQVITVKTADYVILDDNLNVYEFSGAGAAGTFTLPTLADNLGRVIELHNADPMHKVTLDGEGAETIDGKLTIVLPSQYNYIKVRAGTATWHILEIKANYDTGWVANNDWTTVELVVTHNLTANLSDLIVKMFISTDGTEANAFEIGPVQFDNSVAVAEIYGVTFFQVSTDAIKIQTATQGIAYFVTDAGTGQTLNTEAYYYKVVVYSLL